MKKLIQTILIAVVTIFFALPSPKTVHATLPGYDFKSTPGIACQYYSSTYAPITNGEVWQYGGGPPAPGQGTIRFAPIWGSPANPLVDNWTAVCPLVRDNMANTAGINSAIVELSLGRTGDYGTETCWIDECNATGNCASGPHTVYQMPDIGHIHSMPALVPPTGNWAAASAVVVCTLTDFVILYQVRYNEIGANNGDW